MGVPGLLEQPRRSKMRKLAEWVFLLSAGRAFETWLASCQYGSPHLKEFVFLSTFEEAGGLHRRCSRDHVHVKIQGKWTKPSAIYTDELAEAIGRAFDKALVRKLRLWRSSEPNVQGLESIVTNDLLLGGGWSVQKKSWKWRGAAHINIFESTVVNRLLKELSLTKPKNRCSIILDSNVGLSAHVKGRTPSFGLRPCLRRSGAIVVAGCLYPSYHFGPTRLNVADCPTRDYELPPACLSVIPEDADLGRLLDLCSLSNLNRRAANWVRLFLLLANSSLPWISSRESRRFADLKFSRYPWTYACRGFSALDFDQTCGFPGEGPFVETAPRKVEKMVQKDKFRPPQFVQVSEQNPVVDFLVGCLPCDCPCLCCSGRPFVFAEVARVVPLLSLAWSVSVLVCLFCGLSLAWLHVGDLIWQGLVSHVLLSRRLFDFTVAACFRCLSGFVWSRLGIVWLVGLYAPYGFLMLLGSMLSFCFFLGGFALQGRLVHNKLTFKLFWVFLILDPTMCHGAPVPSGLQPRDAGAFLWMH